MARCEQRSSKQTETEPELGRSITTDLGNATAPKSTLGSLVGERSRISSDNCAKIFSLVELLDASSLHCILTSRSREKERKREGGRLTASSSRSLSLSLSLSLSFCGGEGEPESSEGERGSRLGREGDEEGKKEFTNCKMQLSALVRGVSRSAPLEWVAKLLYRVCNPASLRAAERTLAGHGGNVTPAEPQREGARVRLSLRLRRKRENRGGKSR
jgi:hypothetical protein